MRNKGIKNHKRFSGAHLANASHEFYSNVLLQKEGLSVLMAIP